MNSARPCRTTTVPLRPGGGAQRAKRRLTPSEVLIAPATTSSGTGLAGMETSFMKEEGERWALRGFSRGATALNPGLVPLQKPLFFNSFFDPPPDLQVRTAPPYQACAGPVAAHG